MRRNILILILVVIIIVTGGYYFLKTKQEVRDRLNDDIIYTPEQQQELDNTPIIYSPTSNSKVTSPLTIKGRVPAGWMFEGVAQVKLLDTNRNVIAQAPAEEVTPGAWTDEEPDKFKSTLTFTTTAKSGHLVIEADNPSGLPENDKSYQIPVKF
ncbi:hypothetical protein HYT59_01460 [Candidatus Woesebacteria bacterium]|nr:hypothetical protein [Candidatus Woesebacteria bacterium]